MSMVSMIDPSPDWIVGVSSLELCLRNCTWIESKVLNLYPWDIGTDDGVSYLVKLFHLYFKFSVYIFESFLVSRSANSSNATNT